MRDESRLLPVFSFIESALSTTRLDDIESFYNKACEAIRVAESANEFVAHSGLLNSLLEVIRGHRADAFSNRVQIEDMQSLIEKNVCELETLQSGNFRHSSRILELQQLLSRRKEKLEELKSWSAGPFTKNMREGLRKIRGRYQEYFDAGTEVYTQLIEKALRENFEKTVSIELSVLPELGVSAPNNQQKMNARAELINLLTSDRALRVWASEGSEIPSVVAKLALDNLLDKVHFEENRASTDALAREIWGLSDQGLSFFTDETKEWRAENFSYFSRDFPLIAKFISFVELQNYYETGRSGDPPSEIVEVGKVLEKVTGGDALDEGLQLINRSLHRMALEVEDCRIDLGVPPRRSQRTSRISRSLGSFWARLGVRHKFGVVGLAALLVLKLLGFLPVQQ
jgi:hypothetical protein